MTRPVRADARRGADLPPAPSRVERVLPLRVVSEQNAREHWAVRAGRAKRHRGLAALALRGPVRALAQALQADPEARATVTLQRILGPRARMFDGDGHVASLKHVRDGVADALGVDDGDRRVLWVYGEQVRGAAHGVRVVVERREA